MHLSGGPQQQQYQQSGNAGGYGAPQGAYQQAAGYAGGNAYQQGVPPVAAAGGIPQQQGYANGGAAGGDMNAFFGEVGIDSLHVTRQVEADSFINSRR